MLEKWKTRLEGEIQRKRSASREASVDLVSQPEDVKPPI